MRYPSDAPTWQQLGLSVTGPGGAAVPVATYRSSARYDLEPGRAGRAVATFQATTAGPYRVSAARAIEAGATLAVGDDIARSLVLTRLGAVILGLATVLAAVLVAVVTYQARSRTKGVTGCPGALPGTRPSTGRREPPAGPASRSADAEPWTKA